MPPSIMKPRINSRKTLIVLLVVVLFSGLAACVKDNFKLNKLAKPQIEPSVAIPIISSELNLMDVLENTSLNIHEDPDTKLVTLVYESLEIFSHGAEDLMLTPDQHFTIQQIIDYIPPLPGGVFTYGYSTTQIFETEIEFQRIDSLFFKGGIMKVKYTSNIDYASQAFISSPSLREIATDNPFTINTYITPGIGAEFEVELKDYYMVFVSDQGVSNTVSFDFLLEVEGDENAVGQNYQFDTDIFFTNILFQKKTGYLGQYNYGFNDTIFFDIFNNLTSGHFQLGSQSVNLDITIHNSFGMPLWMSFDPFVAHSPINPPYQINVKLFGPDLPNEVEIPAPSYEQIGQSVSIKLETQSNIAEAINLSPQFIHVGLIGITNPGWDTTAINFALDTSRFSVDIVTRLELFGLLENFILQDTLDFSIEIPDEIESIEFKIRTMNGFPLEVDFQAFFMDAAYEVLDSLITDQVPLIHAAPVGDAPGYKVTQPIETTFLVPFPKEKISKISQSEYMLIKGVLSTSNNENVKIYSDYSINVRMSAIFNAIVTP